MCTAAFALVSHLVQSLCGATVVNKGTLVKENYMLKIVIIITSVKSMGTFDNLFFLVNINIYYFLRATVVRDIYCRYELFFKQFIFKD